MYVCVLVCAYAYVCIVYVCVYVCEYNIYVYMYVFVCAHVMYI
jgi:hypothetical protein